MTYNVFGGMLNLAQLHGDSVSILSSEHSEHSELVEVSRFIEKNKWPQEMTIAFLSSRFKLEDQIQRDGRMCPFINKQGHSQGAIPQLSIEWIFLQKKSHCSLY